MMKTMMMKTMISTMDSELLEIIKLKEFKNAWGMLEYLLDIGCEESEILEILPEFFTQIDYFKDVAYGRIMGLPVKNGTAIDDVDWVFSVGMIDDSNENLRAMFDSYKKAVVEHKLDDSSQKDLESLCNETYRFTNLSDPTVDYFRDIAIKHYGYALI